MEIIIARSLSDFPVSWTGYSDRFVGYNAVGKPTHLSMIHLFSQTTMSIKTAVEDFLSGRPHEVGETVQFAWFVFRIAARGQPPRVESLDFRQVASFTQDFSEAERIHTLQAATVARFGAVEPPCTLRQSALVSLSYYPGRADTFLERQSPTDSNDSGWYVGVRDESRSLDDVGSFARRSLYDLTIHDMRMAAYWLLPKGIVVSLDDAAS